MANNRLYVVHRKSATKLLLAKSFGDGWRVFHQDLVKRLDDLFDDVLDVGAYGQQPSELTLETEMDTVNQTPVDFKWYWVKLRPANSFDKAPPWFPAQRRLDVRNGWMVDNEWDDFGDRVVAWVPLPDPPGDDMKT